MQNSKTFKNFMTVLLKNQEHILTILGGLFVFSLWISRAIPNIMLIPLILVILFGYKKLVWKKLPPFWLFIAALFWMLLMDLTSGNIAADFSVFWRYLLILFSFLIFSQSVKRDFIEYLFLIGAAVAMGGSLINIGVEMYQNPDFILANGITTNKILWLERPYFGFMLSLAIYICLRMVERKKRYIYYLPAFIFFVFTLYISARLAIIADLLLIFIFLIRTDLVRSGFKFMGATVLVILVGTALLFNQNFMQRIIPEKDLEQSFQVFKDYEPRFIIWPCATKLIKEDLNLLTGFKSQPGVEKELYDCYADTIDAKTQKEKRDYYLKSLFNTHNQFLGFFLFGGVFPFLFLLIMFAWIWLSPKTTFDTKMVFLLFFLFFMVENVLDRQLGCYLFGIFAGLYLRPKWEK